MLVPFDSKNYVAGETQQAQNFRLAMLVLFDFENYMARSCLNI